MKRAFLIFVMTAVVAQAAWAAHRVGVAVATPPWNAGSFVRETVEYLTWQSGEGFEIVYADMPQLAKWIEAGDVEFFAASPSVYGDFSRRGVRVLASLVSGRAPNPDEAGAAAVVVRPSSRYQTLGDLKGANIAAESEGTVAGMLAVQGEIAAAGNDPDRFFASVLYLGATGGKKALQRVLEGYSDAAVVRAGLLEDMAEDGRRSAAESLRVLPATVLSSLRDKHSTAVYPGLVFGATRTAPRETVRTVLGALLNKPVNAWGERWSVSSSLDAVDRLMKRVRVGPYEYERYWTVNRIWTEYRTAVVLAAAALVFLLLHGALAERLVRRRTRELTLALQRQKESDAKLRLQSRQIEALERSGIVGQLSAVLAHDLKHPLAAILNIVRGTSAVLEQRIGAGEVPIETGVELEENLERIGHEAERASAAIDHVRARAKMQRGDRKPMDLAAAVRTAAADFAAVRNWPHALTVTGEGCFLINGRPMEIELMLLNLLKNAADACAGVEKPAICCRVFVSEAGIGFSVTDNGPAVSDATLEEMRAFAAPTSKSTGLGLGLGIVKSLAESHLARIEFERTKTGGMTVTVVFPSVKKEENDVGKCIDSNRG